MEGSHARAWTLSVQAGPGPAGLMAFAFEANDHLSFHRMRARAQKIAVVMTMRSMRIRTRESTKISICY